MNKKRLLLLLVFSLAGAGYGPGFGGIENSKHNLSVSGPGAIKASSEARICLFCHTSHNPSPAAPLWNRYHPGGGYIPYSSSTANARPGEPTGVSILCLSCHDGTIALGKLISRKSEVQVRGGPRIPAGRLNLTKDLSDDHPISFDYSTTQKAKPSKLVPSSTLTGDVRLDKSGQLQCTSCHDAHDDRFGKFLARPDQGGVLCLSCHIQDGWSEGSHASSPANWRGKSVSAHACQGCHVPHAADGKERLLRSRLEENVCFNCHGGGVAAQNIEKEFVKFSRHPLTYNTGIHDPAEGAIVNERHVECVDCHEPHAASASGVPSGPLRNIRGVNIAGNEVNPISHEYELCFRCHADSVDKQLPSTARVFGSGNLRLTFSTANRSYHPVAGAAVNGSSPSLAGMPLASGAIIGCKDCHGNDNPSGPAGAHGSRYPFLLVRQNLTQGYNGESASNAALCYGCHNRVSILADQSFPLHSKHVDMAPCTTCHDPHGSEWPRLINFDTSIVSPNGSGILEYTSAGPGTFTGSCSLSCHNEDHDPETY